MVRILLHGVSYREQEGFVQRIAIYLLNSLACQVDGSQKMFLGDLGAISVRFMVNPLFKSFLLRRDFLLADHAQPDQRSTVAQNFRRCDGGRLVNHVERDGRNGEKLRAFPGRSWHGVFPGMFKSEFFLRNALAKVKYIICLAAFPG